MLASVAWAFRLRPLLPASAAASTRRDYSPHVVHLVRRIALVAAFLVTPFGAAERTWKPFNPVLGETFELDKLQNDAYFVAEQVRSLYQGLLTARLSCWLTAVVYYFCA
jgi:hypothetical protein